MSLYGGTDLDSEVKSDEKAAGTSWNSGLKFLQTQIQLKKVAASPQQSPATRSKDRMGTETMNKRNGSRQPMLIGQLPFIGGPPSAKDSLFDEFNFVDDYNPLYPNDYEKAKKRIEEEQKRKHEEERRQENGDKRRKHHLENEDEMWDQDDDHGRELEKRSAGAAIAPPRSLTAETAEESSSISFEEKPNYQPTFGSGSKGLNVAAKIMEKYGYKQGLGLGKAEQGMSTALHVEKTSRIGGKIIHEKDIVSKEVKIESTVATADNIEPITDVLKNPTKVVLLKNMVGPGEVDEDLEPEIKEEMYKYGDVVSVVIFELQQASEEEALRIFVEFQKVDQAIKAVVSLHGRFFGGRSIRAAFYDPERFKTYDLAD